MELLHNFQVPASVNSAWSLLTDVNRVASCLPGAEIENGTTSPYSGRVKIKVGAVVVQLNGLLTFEEVDSDAHRLVIVGEGLDPRGGSGAKAKISMTLAEQAPGQTQVTVATSLQLSGKIAQFGQGMLQDVSDAILRKFVANLEAELSTPHVPGETRTPVDAADDVIDLGAAVWPVLLRRYGAATLGGLALFISILSLIRSKRGRGVAS